MAHGLSTRTQSISTRTGQDNRRRLARSPYVQQRVVVARLASLVHFVVRILDVKHVRVEVSKRESFQLTWCEMGD